MQATRKSSFLRPPPPPPLSPAVNMEGGSGGKEPESLEETLSRHRKEIKELQNKEMNMKQAAAKGSKAEQKAKKKQVEEEISRLSSKLEAKHEEELVSLGYKNNSSNGTMDVNDIIIGISGMSTFQGDHQSKPSKSRKRKEKRAQQEASREQRIQEEQSSIVSDRMIENEKLERKLEPLGLTVNEIKPDGHCLYRAVEDQLSHQSGSSPYNYQELRVMAATYMREHASDFLPFFLSDKDIEADSDTSLMEKFESYCTEVETTAAWGGQLELGALTHCLRKRIIVFSGSFPDVEMGKEYKSDSSDNALPNSSVILSYHRHAFGLGEHYNSVISNSER